MAKSNFYSSKFWRDLRLEALKRDRWSCQVCRVKCLGAKHNAPRPAVDHVMPRDPFANFPTDRDVISNIRTLCWQCHTIKTKKGSDKAPIGLDGFPAEGGWA